MNAMTARGYVTSRMSMEKLDVLHRWERSIGYCLTPSRIFERFSLSEIGDVPESVYRPIETKIWKIYEEARALFKKNHVGCCFKPYSSKNYFACPENPDIFVQHQTDKEIMREQMAFPSGGVGKLRDKFSGNAREEAA